MNLFVTVVGSRETPAAEWTLGWRLSYKYIIFGYIIATGDAEGMDRAAREGALAAGAVEYDHDHPERTPNANLYVWKAKHCTPDAMAISARFHSAWNALRKDGSPVVSNFAKKLHGRNAFQVLGPNLITPSSVVICWTKDRCTTHKDRSIRTGGTGTAISIADHWNVPVVNLAKPEEFHKFLRWTNDIKYQIPNP